MEDDTLLVKREKKIDPVLRNMRLPLSFNEEVVWFFEQLKTLDRQYVTIVFRISGELNTLALEESIKEVQRRQEILRTRYVFSNQTLYRDYFSELAPLEKVELKGDNPDLAEEMLRNFIEEESLRPFDIMQDKLFRARLLRCGGNTQALIISMHQIIFDDSSYEILVNELAELYRSFSETKKSNLPPLAIQYADYAYWQRNFFRGEVIQREIAFWKKNLAGISVLNLPLKDAHTSYDKSPVKRRSINIPATIVADIEQKSLSPFFVLLSAFYILLYRYTGQNDIVIFTPHNLREFPELKNLMGFFGNMLPLRANLAGILTFSDLLQNIEKMCANAFNHSNTPYDKLSEIIRTERSEMNRPLTQVIFELRDTFVQDIRFPEVTFSPQQNTHSEMAKFDISLSIIKNHTGYSGIWEYNSNIIDNATILDMENHYCNLLSETISNTEKNILEYSLQTDPEREAWLHRESSVKLNKPFIEFPQEDINKTIVEVFIKKLTLYKDKIAIKTPKYEMTYRELNHQSNHLAKSILDLCGNDDGRVGLFFEHDAQMIVAALGILKAGKSYVPMDISFPKERLKYIVNDSGMSLIITNTINLGVVEDLIGDDIRVVNIDSINMGETIDNILICSDPSSVAYILYTSGSTGKPKGVVQSHRNVLHHMRIWINNVHLGPEDNASLMSSFGWDSAVQDTFGAILSGATLFPFDVKRNGLIKLKSWIKENQITVWHCTVPLFRHFMDTIAESDVFDTVRMIILGGDLINRNDVGMYRKHFANNCILSNAYGSTESSSALMNFIDQNAEMNRNTLPLGFPVDKTEILLLNEAGEVLVSYGIGEITIKSPYIALGYWNSPENTKINRVPGSDQFIYRTGDLGCLLPDGSISYAGRNDFQIKIRGFRVELSEIEAVLVQCNGVHEAVVKAFEINNGDKALVAYLVTENETGIDEVRQYLKTRLPDYMMPATFEILVSIPLTPNGKIDRQALMMPEIHDLGSKKEFAAPNSKTEEIIAQIWADTLSLPVEKISVNDDFFEIGGHSILVLKVMAELSEYFDIELFPEELFDEPTIKAVSGQIEKLIAE